MGKNGISSENAFAFLLNEYNAEEEKARKLSDAPMTQLEAAEPEAMEIEHAECASLITSMSGDRDEDDKSSSQPQQLVSIPCAKCKKRGKEQSACTHK